MVAFYVSYATTGDRDAEVSFVEPGIAPAGLKRTHCEATVLLAVARPMTLTDFEKQLPHRPKTPILSD